MQISPETGEAIIIKRGNYMGQRKNQLKYRDGDSSSGDFLSPSTGTVSAPIRFLLRMVMPCRDRR